MCFNEEENRAATRIINTLQSISKQSGEVYGKDIVAQILHSVLKKGKISYRVSREILQLPKSMRFPRDTKLDYIKELKAAEKAGFLELRNLKVFKKCWERVLISFHENSLMRCHTYHTY